MAAQDFAYTPDGGVVQTTTVVNGVSGVKELNMKFTNANESGTADFILKRGGWHNDTTGALPSGVTMTTNDIGTFAQNQAYFDKIRTMVAGLRIVTDDPANFDNDLELTEKAPDGTNTVVKINLAKYKQPLGGGTYANEIVIPEKDLRIVFWPGLHIVMKALNQTSYMSFYLPLRGWNKASELTPLRASNI